MSAHRYTGILGKRRQPLVKHRDPQIAAALEVLHELETEKLVAALFADCGVPYLKSGHAPSARLAAAGLATGRIGAWHVALTLAKRHVPGFQVAERKRGRRQRSDHREILVDMHREVHRNKKSIREAAKYVARKRRLPARAAVAIDQLYRRQ